MCIFKQFENHGKYLKTSSLVHVTNVYVVATLPIGQCSLCCVASVETAEGIPPWISCDLLFNTKIACKNDSEQWRQQPVHNVVLWQFSV